MAHHDAAALEMRVVELERRVAQLEARGGARDDADRRVLVAIVAAIGGRRFTSKQLRAHARIDEALAAALLDADIETVRELGKLMARLEKHAEIEGFRLRHCDDCRDGAIWQVVAVRV